MMGSSSANFSFGQRRRMGYDITMGKARGWLEVFGVHRRTTHLILPRPECSAVFRSLALNGLNTSRYALLRRHLPWNFMAKIHTGHVGLDFARMQCEDGSLAAFPLQLDGHMT